MNQTIDMFRDRELVEKQLPFLLPNQPEYNSRWDQDKNGFIISIPNGELFYSEKFFAPGKSDQYLDYFLKTSMADWRAIDWRENEAKKLDAVGFRNINWHHDQINMFGKVVYLPRFSAWYGDNDKPYTYSGLTLQPNTWNQGLISIRNKLSAVTQATFNSVLMNWYRDGNDHMSWHTDAERELGLNPEIASVSFGAERRFLIRRIDDKSVKLELPLRHGTLLIMSGALQHFWQHQVPKQVKVLDDRLNLTFRNIKHHRK